MKFFILFAIGLYAIGITAGCQSTGAASNENIESIAADQPNIQFVVDSTYPLPAIASVTDMRWIRECDDTKEVWRLLVVGPLGAVWLNQDLTVQRSVHWEQDVLNQGRFHLIDLDGDSSLEALQVDQLGLQEVSARSLADGSELWRFSPPGTRPIGMVAPVRNADKSIRIIVRREWGRDEQDEIAYHLSPSGELLEKRKSCPMSFDYYKVIDFDGDGADEIVTANQGELYVQSDNGELLWSGKPAPRSYWRQLGYSIEETTSDQNQTQRLAVQMTLSPRIPIFGDLETGYYIVELERGDLGWEPNIQEETYEEFGCRVRRSRGVSVSVPGLDSTILVSGGPALGPYIVNAITPSGLRLSMYEIGSDRLAHYADGGLVPSLPDASPSPGVLVGRGDRLYLVKLIKTP